jgi:DNA-binding transcriptional ArsR family regulator
MVFMVALPHPDTDRIDLARVMESLSDPTRLAVVAFLASLPEERPEARCGAFTAFGSKQNLTYHLAKLREAGVTRARPVGTSRYISLRQKDLDARFPGLLASIIAAALSEPDRVAMVQKAQEEQRADAAASLKPRLAAD